ncbi:glycoside hydrolase family 18 protein [Atractiella rhizophila]|nr:glycoside hydrolase family 18 protein [Atractiella rhizophila]
MDQVQSSYTGVLGQDQSRQNGVELDPNGDIIVEALVGGDETTTFASATVTRLPNPKTLKPTSKTKTATKTQTRTPTPTPSSPPSADKGQVVAAYYPDWTADVLPPESIDYSKFDIIDFAFAIPNENQDINFTQDDSEDILRRLVTNAHQHGTKVLLAIGGWTGSQYFSGNVASSSSRKNFAKNIVNVLDQFDLDGVDLDWEYPGYQGEGSNQVSPDDSANLLIFMKDLRDLLGSDKLITACTGETTFVGPDGSPLKDMSDFGKVMDFILIMNYDVWGASSNPGPNAPFDNGCSNSQQPTANMVSAIKAFKAAKFPLKKILMGLPFYGYVSQSNAQTLVNKRSLRGMMEIGLAERKARDAKRTRRDLYGDLAQYAWNALVPPLSVPPSAPSLSSNHANGPISYLPLPQSTQARTTLAQSGYSLASGSGDLSSYIGSQAGFRELVNRGALAKSSSGKYVGKNGYVRKWDSCSSTPFLVNSERGLVVTYDDPESLAIKAAYAYEVGIGGMNSWEMSGDLGWDLVRSVRAALMKDGKHTDG